MTIQRWADSPATAEAQHPGPWRPNRPTTPEPTAVTSWDAPAWANDSARDEECVIHRRTIGEVRPSEDDRSFTVDVFLRDELTLTTGSTAVTRTPARISVNGHILSGQEARDLARLLNAASDVVEPSEAAAVQG